jgi:cell division protease FtsH
LTELANVLLDKEVIFKDNLQKIFGNRPFETNEEEKVVASE